ncbi:MAG: signal peptidase II [Elusimicrobiota bacterium]|jgi:signal peptidase II|nr:signal peptidase II [Elusimicrobiota bacterium]
MNSLKKIFGLLKNFNIEILVGIICFFVDQISKIIIIQNFYMYESIPVIKNIFYLTYIQNSGIAFGILQNRNMFIIIFILIVIIGYFLFIKEDLKKLYNTNNNSNLFRFAIGLLIGGAIGNFADRIFLGSVVDFLDFKIWPIFNFADTFICIAIGYFIIHFIFIKAKKSNVT